MQTFADLWGRLANGCILQRSAFKICTFAQRTTRQATKLQIKTRVCRPVSNQSPIRKEYSHLQTIEIETRSGLMKKKTYLHHHTKDLLHSCVPNFTPICTWEVFTSRYVPTFKKKIVLQKHMANWACCLELYNWFEKKKKICEMHQTSDTFRTTHKSVCKHLKPLTHTFPESQYIMLFV